jgi:hypothetical protein
LPLVRISQLLALSGRIGTDTVSALVNNLRESWVIKGMGLLDVRLTEGGAYNWLGPKVSAVDKAVTSMTRWDNDFSVRGNGPSIAPQLTQASLEEIDGQLRTGEPPFNGFDGLCGKLSLPSRRDNLQSSFQLSAELPARFNHIEIDAAGGKLEIEVECVGQPELMIEWLPQHETERVSNGWQSARDGELQHVSVEIQKTAESAELILSFPGVGRVGSDLCDIKKKRKAIPQASVPAKTGPPESERWKGTGRTLPEGGQAHVFEVEDRKGEFQGKFVQKRLKNVKDPTRKARFEKEVRALHSIDHPNVLKVIDFDLDAERPYYVSEYCTHGSLDDTGALPYKANIQATSKIVLPIVEALVAAHRAGVIHRDIKPGNILIREDGTPVIGDFGICFMEGEEPITMSNEGVGSRNFIAPEMESGQHDLGEPSDRTDVYCLGKVIYWMLSGGKEFAREEYPSLRVLLNDQKFDHVQRLLDQMVVRDPQMRIASDQVSAKLEMTISLVEGNFAPLIPSIGIRCRFCGIGKYERAFVYGSGNSYSVFGLGESGQRSNYDEGKTALLRCGHCGHIEWFQLADITCKGWWDE